MGKFTDKLLGKLKDIVAGDDKLIESQPESSPQPSTATAPDRSIAIGAPKLVRDVDYYMEGNYMVLTADYLRRRGYCCESGCRHCPYGFTGKKSGKLSSNG